MIEIARVLCPIDFSECSLHALEHARGVARWFDAPMTVLHAVGGEQFPVSESPFVGYAGLPAPVVDTERYLAEEAEQVRRFCDPVLGAAMFEVVVRPGRAADEIVDLAGQSPAALLVLGTHGRSGYEHLVLGSVTEKVLRKTRCPVLTIPPRVAGAAAGDVPYKTIVCALDFSSSSLRALEYAFAWAKAADARLILLHVLDARLDERSVAEMGQVSLSEYYRRLKEEAQARLQSMVPVDAGTWCRPECSLVSGTPHEEILRVASETAAELIVMGVHGRGALGAMFFGSTTNQVVRGAACPVLTVKG